MKDVLLKQRRLEEKVKVTKDSLDQYQNQLETFQPLLKYTDRLKELKEKYLHEEEYLDDQLKFLRLFMCHLCSDTQHWKYLAHGIYRVKQLIKALDNYQVREFLQQSFQIPFEQFIGLMKEMITEQMNSQTRRQQQTLVSNEPEDNLANTKYDFASRPFDSVDCIVQQRKEGRALRSRFLSL